MPLLVLLKLLTEKPSLSKLPLITLIKQSGGAGQFAKVVMEFQPLQKGEGFVFEVRLLVEEF